MLRGFVIFIVIIFLSSCEKPIRNDVSVLAFSDDTIFFDTVFTTIGSTTRELRVINISRDRLLIDNIYLAGGTQSPFRINIDGEAVLSRKQVQIFPRDSVIIFVDVIIDPINNNHPVFISDSIIFETGGDTQKVFLNAWGQDIILFRDQVIQTSTWSQLKPYLIYGNLLVDTSQTLFIEKGVKVLFHKNSSMTVAGNIIVSGTYDAPVLFASDRLEQPYYDVPGQWKGIFISSLSSGNFINHAEIRNPVFGIRMGDPADAGSAGMPSLKLNAVSIMHSSVTGLAAYYGNVEAVNSVFAHCGTHCLSLTAGGEYNFVHCTLYNSWEYGIRLTPLMFVSEKSQNVGGVSGQLGLTLTNCAVYGDLISEIMIVPSSSFPSGNYYFDHCLLKIDTASFNLWDPAKLFGVIVNKDPRFIKAVEYDFRPDTLSPLINSGNIITSDIYPEDIRGASRLNDTMPDIGAWERVPGESKTVQR